MINLSGVIKDPSEMAYSLDVQCAFSIEVGVMLHNINQKQNNESCSEEIMSLFLHSGSIHNRFNFIFLGSQKRGVN